MNKEKLFFLLRSFFIAVSFILIIWLIAKDMAWSGQVKYSTDFKKYTPFFSTLGPQERVKINDIVALQQEPVYFDLSLPRDFESAKFDFTYQPNEIRQLEIAMQMPGEDWEFKPLNNQLINNLNWPQIESGALTLFQRQPKYSDIDQFLQDLPPLNEIAVYYYDLAYNYKIADYQATNDWQTMNIKISGSYQFYTYIKNEDLNWQIDFSQSFNSDQTLSDTTLHVYDLANQEIAVFSPQQDKIVANLKNLPEGAYRLELVSNPLYSTESIKTTQQYLTFLNYLYLVSPGELVTNCQDFSFISYSNNGLQTITVADQPLKIAEVWQQYEIQKEPGFKKMVIPNGNLEITALGLMAANEKQYFNPLVRKVTPSMDFDKENINYLITTYQLPVYKGDYLQNSVQFDLFDKNIANGKVKLLFSIPDLSLEKAPVLIKDVSVTLNRTAIWQESISNNIKEYLKFYKNEIL